MKDSLQTQYAYVVSTLKELYRRPLYIGLLGLVACIVLSVLILLPNFSLLKVTFASDYFSFSEKFWTFVISLGAFETNFTRFSQITTILVSFLIGTQVSLLVLYIRKRAQLQKSIGASTLGTMFSLLGVGCTACGSVILSSVFGISAVTAVLGWLPFKGTEITILGLLILLWSVWYTAYTYSAPITCTYENKT